MGISIAFVIHSLDHSLSTRLIAPYNGFALHGSLDSKLSICYNDAAASNIVNLILEKENTMNISVTAQIAGLVILYLGGIFLIGNYMATALGKRIDELGKRMDDMRSDINARMGGMQSGINARMDDMRSDITTRMDDLRSDINSRMDDMRSHFDTRIDDMRSQMSGEHDKLAEKVDGIDKKLTQHINDHDIHEKWKT